MHGKGTYTWYTFVDNIAKTNDIDFNEIKLDNFDKEKEKLSQKIKLQIQENFEKSFFEKLQCKTESSKLFLYSKIKKTYIINPFLLTSNFESRKILCKMRISDHFLEIEKGRYKNVKREERICHHCNLNEIDDEKHLFLNCTKNITHRENLIKNINDIYPNIGLKNDEEKIQLFLSCPDILQFVVPFIEKSWSPRKVDSIAA